MAKPELGNKHLCQNCGARFFDFMAAKPACLTCDTVAVVAPPPKRRGRVEPQKPAAKAAVKKSVVEVSDGDSDDDDNDDDDDLIVDDLDVDVDDDEDDDFVNLDDDDEDDLEAIGVDDKKGAKIDDE